MINQRTLYAVGGVLTLLAATIGYFTIGDDNSVTVSNTGSGNNINLDSATADNITVSIGQTEQTRQERQEQIKSRLLQRCGELRAFIEPEVFEGGSGGMLQTMTVLDGFVDEDEFVESFSAAQLTRLKSKIADVFTYMNHWTQWSANAAFDMRSNPVAIGQLQASGLTAEQREQFLQAVEADSEADRERALIEVRRYHAQVSQSADELCQQVADLASD